MVKEDRKKTKVASAARAGQLLGTGASAAPSGLGFGGYVGSQSLTANQPADSKSSAVEVPSTELDAEISVHVKRLSKRETITKVKALQALKPLVAETSSKQLTMLLPSWTHIYQRLAMDNSRVVRGTAAELTGMIGKGVGRDLAPFLVHLIGPWLLAQHDLQKEVAKTATEAMSAAFPGPKTQEALLFCSTQLLDYLGSTLKAAPETLGDPQRETPEEITERYHRVMASCFSSISALLEVYRTDRDSTGEVAEKVKSFVADVIAQPGFWKKFLGSKAAIIRRHVYTFLGSVCRRLPTVLEQDISQSSLHMLGAFADKEAGNHGEMWGMILGFSKAVSNAWESPQVQKTNLPKLLSFLSHACYGSAESSYPALLPLLTFLPASLGKDFGTMGNLLEAVLQGWSSTLSNDSATSTNAANAALACLIECWFYTLAKAEQGNESKTSLAAAEGLSERIIIKGLLSKALLTSESQAAAARNLLGALAFPPSTQGSDPRMDLQAAIFASIGQAVVAHIREEDKKGKEDLFKNVEAIVIFLDKAAPDSCQDLLRANLSDPVIKELMKASGQPGIAADVAASNCLAALIRVFGSPIGEGPSASDFDNARQAYEDTPLDSPASVGQADVILACILFMSNPAEAFVQILEPLLSKRSTDLQNMDKTGKGVALVLLLVDRGAALPEIEILRWRSMGLDNLAYKLLAIMFCEESWASIAGQALGSLVQGNNSESFLSMVAVEKVFGVLQASVGATQAIQREAIFAFLEKCLFSYPAWEALSSSGALPENSSIIPDQLLLTQLVFSEAHSEANGAASRAWKDGQPLKALRPRLNKEVWTSIIRHLGISGLLSELHNKLSGNQDDGRILEFAARTARLHRLSSSSSPIEQGDFDILSSVILSISNTWPTYTDPTVDSRVKQVIASAEHASDSVSNNVMTEFVSQLCFELGFEEALGENRHWLAAELLCAAYDNVDPAKRCQASLMTFLLLDEASISRHLLPVMRWLTTGKARRDVEDGHATQAGALSLLIVSLESALRDEGLRGSSARIAGKVLQHWISHLLHRSDGETKRQGSSGLAPEDEASFSVLVRILRTGGDLQLIESTNLAIFSIECLELARLAQDVDTTTQANPADNRLSDVSACFPVPSTTSEKYAATASEVQHLADLGRKMLEAGPVDPKQEDGEEPFETLDETLSDHQEEDETLTDKSESQSAASPPAETLQAKVLTSVISYCWHDLEPQSQAGILDRLRFGMQDTAVLLEDLVEALSQAAVSAAGMLASDAVQNPKEAMTILHHLRQGLSDEATQRYQEAVEVIDDAFLGAATSDRLQGGGTAWMQASAAYLNQSQACSAATPLSQDEQYLVSDVYRCAYAVGAVGMLAQLAGPGASLLLSEWIADCWDLLLTISQSCTAAAKQDALLLEASKAMDLWAEETGVGCVSASLGILTALHSFPTDLPGIHSLALQTLLQPQAMQRLVQNPVDLEDEQLLEKQAAAESAGQFSLPLIFAGLSPELATAVTLRDPTSSPMETSHNAGPVLLAWAVLLALLLELPARSEKRSRISQVIHDSHSLVPGLLNALVDYLPLPSGKAMQSSGRKVTKVEPSVAAALAAEDRLAGKIPEVLSWTLRKSLLSLDTLDITSIAKLLYRASLRVLPASSRSWFQSLGDKKLAAAIEAYTVMHESGFILGCDLAEAAGKGSRGQETDAGPVEMSIKANHVTREITALVSLQDLGVLELAIQLPASWPLQDTKLECRKLMGLAESQLRRWMLSMTALLRSQNGALSAAIDLWHSNCARQFEGVEECLICYSIIQAEGGQLPKLSCRTCSKRYHKTCLYKWFRSSSKSVCPHCQSTW